MSVPSIRILPHSQEEFPSLDSLQTWLLTALKAQGGLYRLRNRNSIAEMLPGSLALFRYGDALIGEAIARVLSREPQKGRTLAGAEIDYEACIEFVPSSIRLYVPSIKIAALQEVIGSEKDISVARTYHTIPNWDMYALMIASHVNRSGEFL